MASLYGLAVLASSAPVTIKRNPVQDETMTYSVRGVLTVQEQDLDYQVEKSVDRITKISDDGSYTRESTDSGVIIGGNPQPPTDPVIMVNKPSGELISVSGEDTGAAARRLNLSLVYYPDHAVEVGDIWTFAGKKSLSLNTHDFTVKVKYAGEEKIGGIDCFHIEQDSSESEGTNPPSLHHDAWLDTKTGAMVKDETKFKNLDFGGRPVSGHLIFTLIKKSD